MSDERTEEFAEPRLNIKLAVADDRPAVASTHDPARSATPSGEGKRNALKQNGSQDTQDQKVSQVRVRKQNHLPALDDDADLAVEKEQIVTRDGKADLLFTGVLLASAAPASAPKGEWQEYRIYRTHAGKHVFSKVTRNVIEEKDDAHEAEVFDPTPSSVPSQMMRTAREIARARPLTWIDAAVAFFGYDPLAKILYRKLNVRFEEQIG